MKNALIVLMVLTIVTVGAFAGDYHIGVNVKGVGAGYDGDVSPAVEFGYTDDYLGMYAQVGVMQKQALVGLALTLPNVPVQIYGGAGVKAVAITEYTTYTVEGDIITEVEVIDDYWNWIPSSGSGYGSFSDSILVSDHRTDIIPFFEAGIGFDMGPMLWKVGWSNLNGDAVDVTVALSI